MHGNNVCDVLIAHVICADAQTNKKKITDVDNLKQSLDHLVKISAEWQTLSRHYLQQCNSSNDELKG